MEKQQRKDREKKIIKTKRKYTEGILEDQERKLVIDD